MLIGSHRTLLRARPAASAPSFLPSDIASLWNWIDPAVNSFQNINGTTAATADGDNIGRLTDRSGNSRHWNAAANDTTRPVLKTNIINSLPVARFTAASLQYLIGASMGALTAGEIFVVMKRALDPPVSDDTAGIWWLTSLTGSATADHVPYSDGNVYCAAMSSARKSCGDPTPSLASAFRLLDIWSATNDWAFQIDGSAFFSTATNTVGMPTTPWLGRSEASASVTLFLNADIAEVCIFSAKLSGADRTSMKAYIATKYGLTIA